MTPEVTRSAPVFRSFDAKKARGLLRGLAWLRVGRESHRFNAGAPLYAFLRLGAFHLHLSEHHGDATPGSTAIVYVEGLAEWHQRLAPYPNMNPELEALPWGVEMVVTDPFGNRLRFVEQFDGA